MPFYTTAAMRMLAAAAAFASLPAWAASNAVLGYDDARHLLARTGYRSIGIEDVRPPMQVGHDVESAYAFLSRVGNTRGLLDDLGADDRITALDNLRSVLAEHATPQGVVLGTASWLVTATH